MALLLLHLRLSTIMGLQQSRDRGLSFVSRHIKRHFPSLTEQRTRTVKQSKVHPCFMKSARHSHQAATLFVIAILAPSSSKTVTVASLPSLAATCRAVLSSCMPIATSAIIGGGGALDSYNTCAQLYLALCIHTGTPIGH